MTTKKAIAYAGCTMMTALCAVAASAQPAAPGAETARTGGIEDIVVTAQRREESLQQVPLAISAVSSKTLEASGVRDVNALAQVTPGLQTINQRGALTPYLRGVGTQNSAAGEEGSVAVYVDGVYYPSAAANILSLSNIERVEVLRGPQGTLFGRNATGGLVHIITRQPSHDSEVKMSLGYANYDTISGSFYGTTGLTDTLAVDLAVGFSRQNKGWGYNSFLNEEVNYRKDFTARGKILWDISDSFSATLSLDYARINSDIGNTRTAAPDSISPGNILIDGIGLPPGTSAFDTRASVPRNIHIAQGGASLKLQADLGWGTLTSTTAYRKYHSPAYFDQDGTPLAPPTLLAGANAARSPVDALLNDRTRTFQQELLLNSTIGRLDLTTGLFYYNASARWDPIRLTSALFAAPFGGARSTFDKQATKSYAAFSQGTYHFSDYTAFTVGLRYTHDKRDLTGINVGANGFTSPATGTLTSAQTHRKWNKLTWRLALEQKLGDDVLTYASYSRGFKSGVFNLTSPNTPAVNPEQIDAYAVGFKSDLFDKTVRFNLEAFWYDYKDIQLALIQAGGTQLLNAAKARVKGIEAELMWAPRIGTGDLRFTANASVLDGKYRRFPNAPLYVPPSLPIPVGATACSTNTVGNRRCSIDASGKDMVITPDFTGTASIDYSFPISEDDKKLGFNISYYYNSGFTWQPDGRIRQPKYGLLNGQISLTGPDEAWALKLWGQNLTNKLYYTSMSHAEYGDQAGPGAPRTYGVTLDVKF